MPSKAKQSAGRTNGLGAPSGAGHALAGGPSRPGGGRGSSPPEGPAGPRSEKDRKALEKLVETGKSKGFLTYDG
jgi:RNA polymerase primary sigma factor